MHEKERKRFMAVRKVSKNEVELIGPRTSRSMRGLDADVMLILGRTEDVPPEELMSVEMCLTKSAAKVRLVSLADLLPGHFPKDLVVKRRR